MAVLLDLHYYVLRKTATPKAALSMIGSCCSVCTTIYIATHNILSTQVMASSPLSQSNVKSLCKTLQNKKGCYNHQGCNMIAEN